MSFFIWSCIYRKKNYQNLTSTFRPYVSYACIYLRNNSWTTLEKNIAELFGYGDVADSVH